MPTQIRHANPSDYGRVIQHVNAWWGGRDMAPMLPKLFFLHFEGTSFVAEDDDGQLVAFLIGFLSQTDPRRGVHPLRRRRARAPRLGLGRELYERFFAVVAEQGRTLVRCVTSPVNEGSVAFHESLGFRPSGSRTTTTARARTACCSSSVSTEPGAKRPVASIGRHDVRLLAYHRSMAKVIVQHVCSECGTTTGRWLGKCPGCGAFGSLVEELLGPGRARRRSGAGSPARRRVLAEVRSEEAARISTGVPELDRVLGGGLVPASLVLVGGEPGVGKSTLLLAALGNVSRSGPAGACSSPARSRSPRSSCGPTGSVARSRSRSSPRPSSSPSAPRSSRSGPTSA